jgi:DNA excision repair protein ERCC-2
MAIHLSKLFIRSISQPFDHSQTGISLWTLEDIEERQKRDLEKVDNEIADGIEGGASLQPMKNGDASGGFLAYDDADIMMEEDEMDEFASLGIDAAELEKMELS